MQSPNKLPNASSTIVLDSNAWLSILTRNTFFPSFYAGDAVGSFNSWMRLITGILFGIGLVWFGLPYIEETAQESLQYLQAKLLKAGELRHSPIFQ